MAPLAFLACLALLAPWWSDPPHAPVETPRAASAEAHAPAQGAASFHETFALRHAQLGVAGTSAAPNCVELRSARGTIHAIGGTVTARWSPTPLGFESMELVVAPLDGEPTRGWSNRVLWRPVGPLELREEEPVRVFLQPYDDDAPGVQPFELEIGLELTGGRIEASAASCALP